MVPEHPFPNAAPQRPLGRQRGTTDDAARADGEERPARGLSAVLVVAAVVIAPVSFPVPVAIDSVPMIVVVGAVIPGGDEASRGRDAQQGGDGAERS